MSVYRVMFIGHVLESIRPDGFPKEVIADHIFDVPDRATLDQLVHGMAKKVFEFGGMSTMQNRGEIIDPTTSIERSMLVPIHMISHLTVKIQLIVGSLEDGGIIN